MGGGWIWIDRRDTIRVYNDLIPFHGGGNLTHRGGFYEGERGKKLIVNLELIISYSLKL